MRQLKSLKIVCLFKPSGPSFVLNGWSRVCQALGHQWHWWVPAQKSAHDIFNEVEPDVFLGTTFDLDRATANCIRKRKDTLRVALYASAWGPLIDRMDLAKYPVVAIRDEEKKLLEGLKKETGLPNFVHLHTAPSQVEGVLGGWNSIGIRPLSILNAADTFAYAGGQYRAEFDCEVAVLSGFWPYKARKIGPWLLPLCHPDHPAKLRVKIWGNGTWPVRQYLGMLDEAHAKDVFASATVCPNVSESHATECFQDLVERPYKVLAAGGFCITDNVIGLDEVFTEDELPRASTPQEFQDKIVHFVRNPQARLPYMRAGQRKVFSSATYWHRVSSLFGGLGLYDYAQHTMYGYAQWLQVVNHG